MFEVGVYEAKANLSEIIRRVMAGEECIITQRNNPVAKVSAYQPIMPRKGEAMRRWRKILKDKPLAKNWKELKAMMEEGR